MKTTLDVLVGRPYMWWALMAVLTNPRYENMDIAMLDEPRSGSGDLMVSSHLVSVSGMSEELRRRRSAEVILWDGQRSFDELLGKLPAEAIELWTASLAVVGQDPSSALAKMPHHLLFTQSAAAYNDFPKRLGNLMERVTMPGRARLIIKHRLLGVAAKHLLADPIPTLANRREIVFAGQSGRISLQHLLNTEKRDAARLIREMQNFESLGKPIAFPIEHAIELVLKQESLVADRRRVALRALYRAYALSAVRDVGLPVRYIFYPHRNINIYQSPLLSRAVYLDFGGVNGDEQIYPRAADLLALRKDAHRVAMPESWSCPRQASEDVDQMHRSARNSLKSLQEALAQKLGHGSGQLGVK